MELSVLRSVPFLLIYNSNSIIFSFEGTLVILPIAPGELHKGIHQSYI